MCAASAAHAPVLEAGAGQQADLVQASAVARRLQGYFSPLVLGRAAAAGPGCRHRDRISEYSPEPHRCTWFDIF